MPTMIGYPYNLWMTRDNTLLMDDNPSKKILKTTSNYIVCPTWTVGKVQDGFLMDLVKCFQALVGSGFPVPQYISLE